ncbi:MAG: xylan 1,4-beta-xylosidase, partial [Clostridia bacterium]|nr:xylan 1,4-beta-xylosidase [Clostridia bacterium]
WHLLGEPADLTGEQLAFLRAAGQPAVQAQAAPDGRVTLSMGPNAVVRLRVLPVDKQEDPGYDYSYYCEE